MGMTEYGESLLLDCMLDISDLPTMYLALTSSEPTAFDTGSTITEPLDSAYGRKTIGVGTSNWTTSESGISLYKNLLTYSEATEDWPVITHWALLTASTAGSIIMWGNFTTPQSVLTGQTMTIPANTLGLSVASPEANLIN